MIESLPFVSILIITQNRPSYVKECLAHIRRSIYSKYEIIVVDNSENDETKYLCNNMKDVQYIHLNVPVGSQPIMRNVGIQNAKGEIIAFTDDDGFVQPLWLERLIQLYKDPMVGGAGGRILQGEQNSPFFKGKLIVGKFDIWMGAKGNYNCDADMIFEIDHLQGTNMSFRKSVLNKIGGWDLAYNCGYATFEETDVCLRVKKSGYKILFDPKAIVYHALAERGGGFKRNIYDSPKLAYYLLRNGTYLRLKIFKWNPALLCAVFVNPIIETLRCFNGLLKNPQLALNPFFSILMIMLGFISGWGTFMRRLIIHNVRN